MKQFNVGAIIFVALLTASLCCAAAEEPIKYSFNVVKDCSLMNMSNARKLPYTLVQLTPKASYECTELTDEEAAAWFPPRPVVVTDAHYVEWDRHVDIVFGGPFQAPSHCDTTHAQRMMKRDYDWFVQRERERKEIYIGGRICVPVSLEQNLQVVNNELAMRSPALGYGLDVQQARLTNLRVAKIEQYRVGLLAEIKGRELCPTIKCQFIELKSYSGLPYILVDAEPKETWEKLDAREPYHIIPKSLDTNPAGTFSDNYIEGHKEVMQYDFARATQLLNRYTAIYNDCQIIVGDVAIPIVVVAIQDLIAERGSHLYLRSNINFVRAQIAADLAGIRMKKDKAFHDELLALQNDCDAVQTNVIANESIPTPDVAPLKSSSRLPRMGGFFAGLGWTGSIWFVVYLLRSYQEGIRVASGCASAAAGMAFLFARHKLAQEGTNHKFWRGVRDGAGISTALGAGLFLAHDSSVVQKLMARASCNS